MKSVVRPVSERQALIEAIRANPDEDTHGALPPSGASRFGSRRYLSVSNSAIGAAAPWVATVRTTHLFRNALAKGVEHLLKCSHLDELELLTLEGNRVGPEVREQVTARLGDRVRF